MPRNAVSAEIRIKEHINSSFFSEVSVMLLPSLCERVMITLVEVCVAPNMVSMYQG